jgi:5-methylcytosine-specific restriction enzyme B
MRMKHAENLYKLWDGFLETFLFNKQSFLTVDTDEKEILNDATLAEIHDKYITNYDASDKSFDEKIEIQFKDASEDAKLVFTHAEWLWAIAASDIRVETKKNIVEKWFSEKARKDVFVEGFGSTGQWHKNKKYEEIRFIITIFKLIYKKVQNDLITNKNDVNKWIEQICLYSHYDEEDKSYPISDEDKNEVDTTNRAMNNILLHLVNPDLYERISSDSHKNQIISTFELLVKDDVEDWELLNYDQKIKKIRDKISHYTNINNFDFYRDYENFWNFGEVERQFDAIQSLIYKKAIILYGPPGTSKTYSAEKIAQAIIIRNLLKKKEDIKLFFENKKDFFKSRIHRRQLHPNYAYEDFIAGIQIKDGKTVPTKGDLFRIIEDTKKDNLPHVLILDEINRVDISRLFGEVFSAMENRNKKIDLSLGGFSLEIPENLYFIGTMNEIDFSLERMDFALRRRFVWIPYGFNNDLLRDILELKQKYLKIEIREDDIESYIERCIELNEYISENIPELGKEYEIGHTFFAEIVDIYSSYVYHKGAKKKISLFKKNGPIDILWQISIEPIIKAFLGNMISETREEYMKEMEKRFLHG